MIVYRMQGMCSRDEAVTLFHALTRTLADVTAALVAIEKGSYGVCVECHEPIALTRLEIIPWAPYCIRCQEVFQYRKQMMSSARGRSGRKWHEGNICPRCIAAVRRNEVVMVESRMDAGTDDCAAPFSIPAHQTGHAHFGHPAFRLVSP